MCTNKTKSVTVLLIKYLTMCCTLYGSDSLDHCLCFEKILITGNVFASHLWMDLNSKIIIPENSFASDTRFSIYELHTIVQLNIHTS